MNFRLKKIQICCVTLNFFVYFSKDARLPVQLQRAMAAEAEAAREARAKVLGVSYITVDIYCICVM